MGGWKGGKERGRVGGWVGRMEGGKEGREGRGRERREGAGREDGKRGRERGGGREGGRGGGRVQFVEEDTIVIGVCQASSFLDNGKDSHLQVQVKLYWRSHSLVVQV